MRTLMVSVLASLLLALTAVVDAAPTLVDSRQIWSAAGHNAFTDLIRFQDRWFCVFRESTSHVPGTDGVIRILSSADGGKWSSAAVVSEKGIDLRDPKISVAPDGRLMLLMGGSVYSGNASTPHRTCTNAHTRVSFSADGRAWTAPQPVSVPDNNWLWRVTWAGDTGYGFSYRHDDARKKYVITLWRTRDGVHYDKVVDPEVPDACQPDETTIRVLKDGTMLALIRGEQKNRHAWIGRSAPPYDTWTFTDAGAIAQGPDFIQLPDGRMVYAGRDYPNGARTVVGAMTADKLTPLLTLPSGGDTSYPGLVFHDGLLWVSYYASHEGKTAIYLARIRP